MFSQDWLIIKTSQWTSPLHRPVLWKLMPAHRRRTWIIVWGGFGNLSRLGSQGMKLPFMTSLYSRSHLMVRDMKSVYHGHPPLSDHYDLCRKRLSNLIRRLKQTPQVLIEYDTIIRDQLDKGIVEIVNQPTVTVSDRVHYLPHHGVVR